MSLDISKVSKHKTQHQDSGFDEVSVAALSGELADRQPSKAGAAALGWTDEMLLKGAGAGVAPDEVAVPGGYAPPTRSMWIFVCKGSGAISIEGNYPHGDLALAANWLSWSFAVPADFSSLVSVKLPFISGNPGAATMDYTVTTSFGADGENFEAHTDSVTADGLSPGAHESLGVIDITDAFTGLAAGDFCGVKILADVITNNAFFRVLGLQFNYSE